MIMSGNGKYMTGNEAFTLMELLISVTVILTVVAITGGTFRLVSNSIEKGEGRIDSDRGLNIAVNLMTRQLDTICSAEECMLEGDRNGITFHCYLAAHDTGTPEVYQIDYVAEPDPDDPDRQILKTKQQKAFQLENDTGKEVVSELISGISRFSIAYLKGYSKEGDLYVEEWKDSRTYPLAVKITFMHADRNVEIFSRILNTRQD